MTCRRSAQMECDVGEDAAIGGLLAWVAVVVCVVTVASACHRTRDVSRTAAGPASETTSISGDSVRGVVSRVGNEPGSVIVVASPAGGGESVVLSTADSLSLRAVVGLDIVARGARTGMRELRASPRGAEVFAVTAFTVRAADGVPTTDGLVVTRRGAFLLQLPDGSELPVSVMPMALRDKLGARVWIAGALTLAPQSYGVISERR